MTDVEPQMVNRMEQVNGITVADLVHRCLEMGLDPSEVSMSGGHMRWRSPQTPDEVARQAERDARHAAWERETYERLRRKFEAEDR